MRSTYVWLLTAALALLAMFQDRRWKPLEVFDWDAGGYYVYLPSAFIYHDLGRADSLARLQAAVHDPSHHHNMGLLTLANGRVISKYPLGVALAQLPWFAGAHLYAQATGQPADGFSRPYQQSIMVAGLCYGLLGLWVLRKLLCHYFDDGPAAWALAAVGLGTNAFHYLSFEAAMAHAPLLLWQASLLYCTARWYETPRPRWILGIGLFLGLAALTRPTEALFALIPLAWGITSAAGIRGRLGFLGRHIGVVAGAVLLALVLVSLQLVFWRVVSGQWLVYTYEDGFDFRHPHLLDGLFSFRKGWLLYTPLMLVALLSVGWLRRWVPAALLPTLLLVPVVLYVTFSWEQWWYGGSFGQRSLISLYPLLALPLAALVASTQNGPRWRYFAARTVLALGIVLNLWQTRQYSTGALAWDNTTAEAYRHNFFKPKPD
ncbi:glycosyltransferase family 39 protein [Hymenobacter sp. BT175]|uniref:glycosyltransferase family 39 protein n=1 Tax=Hymenobacter translucens TaxID=2886507 RepID=UPI001D0E4B84|nr:glycosyltransferase family 39 protein [Hymenobacter translucens]MCC2545887.1 glycosyltransferase family 39 protein [Hymenobacter translucens]